MIIDFSNGSIRCASAPRPRNREQLIAHYRKAFQPSLRQPGNRVRKALGGSVSGFRLYLMEEVGMTYDEADIYSNALANMIAD